MFIFQHVIPEISTKIKDFRGFGKKLIHKDFLPFLCAMKNNVVNIS